MVIQRKVTGEFHCPDCFTKSIEDTIYQTIDKYKMIKRGVPEKDLDHLHELVGSRKAPMYALEPEIKNLIISRNLHPDKVAKNQENLNRIYTKYGLNTDIPPGKYADLIKIVNRRKTHASNMKRYERNLENEANQFYSKRGAENWTYHPDESIDEIMKKAHRNQPNTEQGVEYTLQHLPKTGKASNMRLKDIQKKFNELDEQQVMRRAGRPR